MLISKQLSPLLPLVRYRGKSENSFPITVVFTAVIPRLPRSVIPCRSLLPTQGHRLDVWQLVLVVLPALNSRAKWTRLIPVTENRNTSTMRSFKIYSVDGAIYYFRNRSLITLTLTQTLNLTLILTLDLTLTLNLTLNLNLTLMECLKFDSLSNTHFKTPKPA